MTQPDIPGLRVQALHTDDAAEAYRLALRSDVRGAFNVAAEPPVDAEMLGEMLGARPVRLPRTAARSAIAKSTGISTPYLGVVSRNRTSPAASRSACPIRNAR